jgi:hypothetical protein
MLEKIDYIECKPFRIIKRIPAKEDRYDTPISEWQHTFAVEQYDGHMGFHHAAVFCYPAGVLCDEGCCDRDDWPYNEDFMKWLEDETEILGKWRLYPRHNSCYSLDARDMSTTCFESGTGLIAGYHDTVILFVSKDQGKTWRTWDKWEGLEKDE